MELSYFTHWKAGHKDTNGNDITLSDSARLQTRVQVLMALRLQQHLTVSVE